MIDWYHCFIAAVFILWAISTPRDKNALRIVLIASLTSEVMVDEITQQIEGAWKMIMPGALEIATILAMLKWARNRTGYLQAGLLVIAWVAHLLCYVDFTLKTDLVYSKYEGIIFWVSVGQLATCYDTMYFNLSRIPLPRVFFAPVGFWRISPASLRLGVSRAYVDKNLSSAEGKRETS